jgi:anthranilate synthase component 1
MHPPSFAEFQKLAGRGNVIPLAEDLLADLTTPVAAFIKLCGEHEDGFLLESVEGGERFARYSFLGRKPREVIHADREKVSVASASDAHAITANLFAYLQNRLQKYRFVAQPDLPRFCGGFVGYFGYDAVRLLEKLPERNASSAPLARLGFYDTVLAFDHLRQRILIIANAILDEHVNLRAQYEDALQRLAETKAALQRPLPTFAPRQPARGELRANFSEGDFCRAVLQAKEHIRAGDVFQVVLSQKFSQPVSAAPFDIYRALRAINPSPYLYFLRHHGQTLIGSSPELMVRVENGEAVVRPIAGTRPRGQSLEEDQRLAAELLADEKERAEHVMLMDLGRNDIGRVAHYGGVRVTENMIIERYSHVMHLVSEIRGKLRPGMDAVAAFKACFPAGTVTGAPKVRAMEIIAELEPDPREWYAGAMGYLDFSGNLDTCIAIRTLEVQNGVASFQAGAGIVADSIPEKEYAETIHKSNAMRAAIAMAENGL